MPTYVGDAIDLSNWAPPQRKLTRPDGEIVLEKLPQLANVLVLDDRGNSRRLPRANGMGKPIANDPYWNQKKPEKEAAGMIPYGACPKRLGLHDQLPENMRDGAPCKLGADGSPIGNDHPCTCILKLQEVRRKFAEKQNLENEQRLKSRDTRDSEQRDAVFQKFLEEGAKKKP
jgi:hypothetical protein